MRADKRTIEAWIKSMRQIEMQTQQEETEQGRRQKKGGRDKKPDTEDLVCILKTALAGVRGEFQAVCVGWSN